MKTFVASVMLAFVAAPVVAQDCVVMLHGLARTEISMTAMALVLEGEGYRVVNRGYPSTESTIPNLVADHVTEGCGRLRRQAREFRDPFDGWHPCARLVDQ